jgi:hypothetical protein
MILAFLLINLSCGNDIAKRSNAVERVVTEQEIAIMFKEFDASLKQNSEEVIQKLKSGTYEKDSNIFLKDFIIFLI